MSIFSGPIVEEHRVPLQRPLDIENAVFLEKVKFQIQENGIVRPKGKTVSWHVNPEIEKHHFGRSHPMKPWRLTLANGLIMAYGMHAGMDTYLSRRATMEELSEYHSLDYLQYLRDFLPKPEPENNITPFNVGGDDCPQFEGLFNYCSMYSGASLDAARKLCNNQSDIAVNWSGGLHHAKKSEASGFCYMNDIVIAILELLRHFPRVLYIDIDVHHGDGVEEAFHSTDRVMTVSFHKYDPNTFFPGTGALGDTGPEQEDNPGAHHSVNIPLNDGITDEQYSWLFKSVIDECCTRFRPSAIVLQCGADSLAGDRLGRFNLQVQGHGFCVSYCKSLNLPLLLLGGGGYTPRNVARAWAHETSIAIGCEDRLNAHIPDHTPFRSHFRQDTLFPTLEEILPDQQKANRNTQKRLQEIYTSIMEELRFVAHAPSVQMKEIPPGLGPIRDEVDEQLREEREEADEMARNERELGLAVAMEY